MVKNIYIGTSGWHYTHWFGIFYPPEITGYNELRFHSQHFSTVENNASFYRIAQESTYKTWVRMTPDNYKFSMKLNKLITHTHKLELNDIVKEKIHFILSSTQILGEKMGVLVIQLPPSFVYNPQTLETFLKYFMQEVESKKFKWRIAIEFRNKYWFTEEIFAMLRKYAVALVTGQSSRYPEIRHITTDFAYIRMHGPEKLFSSKYSTDQLQELTRYIDSISPQVTSVFVYFNNDFHGYALENAQQLKTMVASHQGETKPSI